MISESLKPETVVSKTASGILGASVLFGVLWCEGISLAIINLQDKRWARFYAVNFTSGMFSLDTRWYLAPSTSSLHDLLSYLDR